MRENTEGLYVGMGGRFKKGTEDEVAIQEDLNTYDGVTRIIDYAFERRRREVVMVDKSNAMTYAGGLWQERWKAVAATHPKVKTRHLYVDAAAMQLVKDPSQFDVIVTGNLFGDILSDLTAELIGGMGIAPSGNINPETKPRAVRTCARNRAGHRRPRVRQPDRGDPERFYDGETPGSCRHGGSDRGCGRIGHSRGRVHARSRRQPVDR